MILRFRKTTNVVFHRNICCFSGSFRLEEQMFQEGDTVEVHRFFMESPKRRRSPWRDLDPYDAARAVRNPDLRAMAWVGEMNSTHPDRMFLERIGDVELLDGEDDE